MIISKMVEELFIGENLTEKQKKIIVAAIEIFAQKGYSDTSTKEIANMAGVAEGTIFRHYQTKKELLQSILDKTLSRFTDSINCFEYKNESFKDLVKAQVTVIDYFIVRYTPIIKILLQEFPFQKAIWEPYFMEINRGFKITIELLQKEAVLVDMEPQVALRLALSTIVGSLVLKIFLLSEENMAEEDDQEMIVNYVVNGLSTRTLL